MPLSQAHRPEGLKGIATSRKILWTGKIKEITGAPTSRAHPACAESWLHTDDCLFLYFSGFGYPNTEAGFLFRSSLQTDPLYPALAAPFDSGSLWEWHDWPGCPPAGASNAAGKSTRAAAARTFLNAHSLAPADCRQYLASVLRQCFGRPSGYLRGLTPHGPDLHQLSPCPGKATDHRRWTFELRVQVETAGGLPMPSPHLEAVFLRSELARDRAVRRFLLDCENEGIDIERFDASSAPTAFEALKNRCIDYLASRVTVALNP
jgi:hypothetical protein